MYNGTAYVNVSDRKVPVYRLTENCCEITNEQIGTIYPNECFGLHSGEGSATQITFRNSSGVPTIGGIVDVFPDCTLYGKKKSNGSTLVDNPLDKEGYYVHTLAKSMNWYIGTQKQSTTLKAGTQLKIKDCTTGADHFYRIACEKAKKPGETEFSKLNPNGVFWVDFLTIGSMPSNRAIL